MPVTTTIRRFSRAKAVCASASFERGITTIVSPEVHDAFERFAAARGVTKAKLIRQVIESVVERPELLTMILEERDHAGRVD